MSGNEKLLLDALVKPKTVLALSVTDWSLLVRLARNANLLASVAFRLESEGLLAQIPKAPLAHLVAATRLAEKQLRGVHFEVDRIQESLAKLDMPVVVLKGAAYVIAGLPPARGRLFADIDILVPKIKLDDVERSMMLHGWVSGQHDAYDQHYYRTWMHELPPLKHVTRQTVIDIHHAILPETARLQPDSKKLLADAVAVEGRERVFVLAPVDMVLHSATHLFHEGEFENGLRDLVDLDALLRHLSKTEGFWDELIERAVDMDLTRPLYYALRYSQQMLQTPVPDVTMKAAMTIGGPSKPVAWLMDALFARALMPNHPRCDDALTPLARWMLYIRSHYLRMPFHLLIPHLLHKAIKKRFSPAQADVPKLDNN